MAQHNALLKDIAAIDGCSGEVARENAILKVLATIITGKLLRRKHKRRILKDKPPRLALPRTRRSFGAAKFLGNHGTCSNIVRLVTEGHVTVAEIEEFLDRTRLVECNRGRIESALRRLAQDAELKAAVAATHSGGNGTTGELSEMIAASNQATLAHRDLTRSRP